MNIKEEEAEIKKEFQLERVILFTDAVFAIILTIMVLELKFPDGLKKASEGRLLDAFEQLIFKFLGYGITFFLVARFWMAHLKLFRFLKDYDTKLLALNLFFLFSVTLFPFAVSLISGSISPGSPAYNWGYTIYILVFYFVAFTQSLISRHLFLNRDKLCINTAHTEANFKWKIQRINVVLIPLMFIVVLIFNYYQLTYIYPLATIFFYTFTIKKLSTMYYPANEILKKLEHERTGGEHIKESIRKVQKQAVQMQMFSIDDPVLVKIRDTLNNLDVNTLTPVEALMKLDEIQRVIKG